MAQAKFNILIGREYDPQTFCREMARLDELNKQLGEVQQQLNQASGKSRNLVHQLLGTITSPPPTVRSLVLNADVVTQFDPHQEARLRQVMEECEACMARVRQRETQGGELASSTANYR